MSQINDQNFLATNMTLLGAFSYFCYEKYGLGSVIVDFTGGVIRKGVGKVLQATTYVPKSLLDTFRSDENLIGPTNKLMGMIERYDPQTGVVAVFLKARDDMPIYRFRTMPAPPVCYQMMKDSLPDFEMNNSDRILSFFKTL